MDREKELKSHNFWFHLCVFCAAVNFFSAIFQPETATASLFFGCFSLFAAFLRYKLAKSIETSTSSQKTDK